MRLLLSLVMTLLSGNLVTASAQTVTMPIPCASQSWWRAPSPPMPSGPTRGSEASSSLGDPTPR